MPEIIIKNATKRFGSFLAVDKLDITIQDKGFVTLLGPSGCGKTTTLRIEMRAELKRLHRETNSTFVYVTHDQLEVMTLSSRICLMKEGRVQQYAEPLKVYNEPSNLFSAEFVGNPTINFVDVECHQVGPENIQLVSKDLIFSFAPVSHHPSLQKGQKLILGLRPECISLSEEGLVRGGIYSACLNSIDNTFQFFQVAYRVVGNHHTAHSVRGMLP
jgi:ABC-type sugar transport system ATPase subunit